MLAAALMLCTLSAWISDVIGLHAVFGAFLIGTAMPRGVFAQRIRQLLEPFTLVFLLPVFFTYSGLNTQLTMVNTPQLLLDRRRRCWRRPSSPSSSPAGRRRSLPGQDNRSALGLGALMNARGLTELIIVNIGLCGRHHRAGAVLHAGAHGHRHHAHGLAAVRAGLRPRRAGARRDSRASRSSIA